MRYTPDDFPGLGDCVSGLEEGKATGELHYLGLAVVDVYAKFCRYALDFLQEFLQECFARMNDDTVIHVSVIAVYTSYCLTVMVNPAGQVHSCYLGYRCANPHGLGHISRPGEQFPWEFAIFQGVEYFGLDVGVIGIGYIHFIGFQNTPQHIFGVGVTLYMLLHFFEEDCVVYVIKILAEIYLENIDLSSISAVMPGKVLH